MIKIEKLFKNIQNESQEKSESFSPKNKKFCEKTQ